jgi:tetraacyldisaccharide 4'-kinase
MARFRRIARPALLPLSLFYGLIVMIRNWLFDAKLLRSTRFKLPVICIGNITVGGTGKTPHVEYLIRQLKQNYNLAVLSRGYKRQTHEFILATSDSGVAEVGDEPLQIKRKFPDVHVAVESDRVLGVQMLMELIPGLRVVLLDDAYQHRTITPGLSVLLIDFTRPVFRDVLLPAGNLRESSRNMRRADIILVTKCPSSLSIGEREKFISRLHPCKHQQVFFTYYDYGNPLPVFPEQAGKQLINLPDKPVHKKKSVLLVTGIANPAPLKQYLANIFDVRDELDFPDHHNYSRNDFLQIKTTFDPIGDPEKYVLVTEKDAVRIRESAFIDCTFRSAFYYIPIEVKFLTDCEEAFLNIINRFIRNSDSSSVK